MRAIQISEYGGPEVLQPAELPEPEAKPGFTLVRVAGAGVNYADTHQVENSYLSPTTLPLVPGGEVVGTAPDGRRVVALLPFGGYAQLATAADSLVFDVDDKVDDGQALSLVLQGVTAWHLLRTTCHLEKGETVVVHAGAGGVGSIAVQLARHYGAGRVIATASTPAKRDLAIELGADVAIDGSPEALRDRLLEAAGGRGVDVVLEMVGGSVFDESVRALAPFGRLATYGQASRKPPSLVDPGGLIAKSRTVGGFWLGHLYARPDLIAEPLGELMGLVVDGTLRPVVGGRYPLSQARRAHEDLLGRATTGKLVLDPEG